MMFLSVTLRGESTVKSAEEIMTILDAFDLTRSFREPAELAACSAPDPIERSPTIVRTPGRPRSGGLRVASVGAPRMVFARRTPCATRESAGCG